MFKKITSTLENLFDQTPTPLLNPLVHMEEEERKRFQAINDNGLLGNLSYIFSEDVTQQNLPMLFSQLAMHFEINLLLSKGMIKDAYYFSKKIEKPANLKPIKLPKTAVCNVFKTNAELFLNHFRFPLFPGSEKLVAYLIPVSSTDTLVVMTPLAEPWAKMKIEALQNTLLKINFSL